MRDDPRTGLRRLRAAARSGELASLCARHHIRILVVFGSVVDEAGQPRDLDIAVGFEHGARTNLLELVDALVRLTGVEDIDVMDFDRAGPVARERALVGTSLLFEGRPEAFARAQMHAITERTETAPLRQLDLELMAG